MTSATVAFVVPQLPLLIVHCRVALVPAATPVTVVLYNVGAVIVAPPLTTVHNPVPGEGLFPAKVKMLLLQLLWGPPAFAAGAGNLFVKTTLDEELGQVPLLIVHVSVALVPAATPVTVDPGDVGVVMVAVPLATVHKPE